MSAYTHALVCEHLEGAPLSARQIAKLTRKGPGFLKLHRYIMEEWPKDIPVKMEVSHKKI